MTKQVGSVKLDLEYYLGEDLYSDGDVENELLDIVQHHSEDELPQIINSNPKWPIVYHLSKERENVVKWFPFEKDASLLEIGAGCGAVTGCLCERVKSVTAVELSKKRSLINAYRHKGCDNLSILVANFKDIYEKLQKRKYDYITLIGVLEYADHYIGGRDAQCKFLEALDVLLNEKGKLIIAIENRLGMKYFAGCKEDHLGTLFSGIEGYGEKDTKVRTFDRIELERLMKRAGYYNFSFYYPYPDYKFAECIYSDERLPGKGELINNIRNYDGNRLVLFNEAKGFDSLVNSGLFPIFSNSFLVVAEKEGQI